MRGGRYLLVVERDSENVTSDDHGRPVVATVTRRLVRGSLTMLSAREVLRAQVYGENLEAASHLPSGFDIDRRDRIVLEALRNPDAPPQLLGTWTVGAVSSRPSLIRALLRRSPLNEDDERGG